MRSLAPLAAAILIGTTAFVANAGVVEDRKANFKANNASMRAIGAAIGAGDFGTVTREAERIAAWAMVMPDYFPEGSNGKPSDASPTIWTDFDGFKNAAKKNETASKKLMVAAKSEDRQAVIDGFKAVASSCKNCHQSYKLD